VGLNMSDQISEKMARQVYLRVPATNEWNRKSEDMFVENLKRAGLIKPSKLDKAREWCRNVRNANNPDEDYRRGVEDTESRFEDSISEILEERN